MAQRVQVVVRLRPFNEVERKVGGPVAASQDGDTIVVHGERGREHTFDKAFGSEASQESVFESVGKPAINRVLEGYNSTLLAYGQTGSGKTHTMLGPSGGAPEALDSASPTYPQRGLIPRLSESLFTNLCTLDSSEVTWQLSVSVFELYKEQLFDSLTESPRDPGDYRIREDVSGGRGVYVDNLFEKPCTTASEVLQAIRVGASRRRVASTQANDTSSRSHSITVISLRVVNHLLGGAATTSRLTLVDLAGSEKVGKTNAGGDRLKEAQSINLSLTLLGNVIYRLTDGKSNYIPYRDSKLTRLLQDSLGGNSCTTLLCCASPATYNKEETISTLAFAARAKQITNKPRVNRDLSTAELKAALAKALDDITDLKDRLAMQAEFFQRQSKGQSPQKCASVPHSEVEDDASQPADEDLKLIIERLMRENGELRQELSELKARFTHVETQVEFHKDRAVKSEDKVNELTAKLRREESLFERRVAELLSTAEPNATPPLPEAPKVVEVQVVRGGAPRRSAVRGAMSRVALRDVDNLSSVQLGSRRGSNDTGVTEFQGPLSLQGRPALAPPFTRSALLGEQLSAVQPLPAGSVLQATDTELMLELESLRTELSKQRQENAKIRASESSLSQQLRDASSTCESMSSERDELRRQLDATQTRLTEADKRNADMKRILDALNIDVEEQLELERRRAAAASSEASSLRGRNNELLEAQAQQEFCDLASAELIFKAEDMDAIENEVLAIRFSRAAIPDQEIVRQSCLETLAQLDDFIHGLLGRISDRRFATANLETCRLNIIGDAVSLQDRVALATKRLRSG